MTEALRSRKQSTRYVDIIIFGGPVASPTIDTDQVIINILEDHIFISKKDFPHTQKDLPKKTHTSP